jgi:hypothetical protein
LHEYLVYSRLFFMRIVPNLCLFHLCRNKTKIVLLDLLRNSPYSRSKLQADTIENVVTNIASQIDGEDRGGKAKKMLVKMVKVNMEQSLRHA